MSTADMASPGVTSPGRDLALLALRLGGVVAVLFALLLWFSERELSAFVRDIPYGLLQSTTISVAAIGMTFVTLPLLVRFHPVVRWMGYVAAWAVAAVVGTLMAPALLSLAGLPDGTTVFDVFRWNIRGTIPTTIVIGAFFMIVESARARQRHLEGLLREQQIARERSERLAAEAQAAALAARVQPHFLFNTLNAIAALVRDDPARAEQTVEQLSALLRGSLDTSLTVPLERELALAADYLEIQRTRMGDGLRFHIEVPEAAVGAVPVPPFSVQGLVENAVKHVAAHRPGGVTIDVRARVSAGQLIVEVHDDGDGFDSDSIPAGHGLDNLTARLKTACGAAAGLEFERGHGTMCVRMRVPLG